MYQIVLTENRKKIKVLYSYSRESDVNYRFEKLKSQDGECGEKSCYHFFFSGRTNHLFITLIE